MTRNSKFSMGKLMIQLLCVLIGIVSLYPLVWMVASSFKESSQVFVSAHSLIPRSWDFSNYTTGWRGFAGITFGTFFKNTIIIVCSVVTGTVVSCSLIAYGFARIPFRLKGFWFGTVMLTLLLPGQIVQIPQYIIFHKLGWVNTFLPLIVPAFFGSAFFIFLLLQFIRTIPYELDEAAKIDGCSRFGIFARVIMPLITPALVTAAIFEFYWSWDNFFGALIYLGKPQLYTISVALRLFADPSSGTDWSAMFAMATLSLIPPILIFFVFQRYIVEGISTTGLKG
ncbi:carbohydrate ABC transporter permease [Paenibacillus donghaensis]|uniref:ABC transporter permease n=1 Tax=Paenibacillus donghaensis TaxID=414771 RepID=A0A2Z2K913_9BACL|nr:carbohydrate ABC transporter permease [Paenibacillus donghaensis]ASA19835.1 ABC transporter permease [Paenibacillus donghaensis]